ncbi:MAG: polysaccharide deacetylase family protein [Nitrospinae bacterium]|nr:polysaccharide deacetylase family protein [Nitrospinota bacterium]
MLNFYGPKNHLAALACEWENFTRGGYPPFVTQWRTEPVPPTIPVFSFHDVTPQALEARLSYLAANGYRTITGDEYIAREGKSAGERLAMLTFDDGRASLWTVAYPLLKKYGMKGVAFVLPGEIKEAAGARPQTPGAAGGLLCTWPEITAMPDVFDVQSHSLTHLIMFVSPDVAAFYNPRIKRGWSRIDRPVTSEGGVDNLERDYPLGTPLYQMDSRFSNHRRMIEPASVRQACAEHVEANGGERFFGKTGWKDELMAVHSRAAAQALFVTETEAGQAESMAFALAESKRILEERLQGHKVRHFCLPFGVGCKLAVEAAAKTGYDAVYWGARPAEFLEKLGSRPKNVGRLKDDFIFRLPGQGRKTLLETLFSKFLRRFGFSKTGTGI